MQCEIGWVRSWRRGLASILAAGAAALCIAGLPVGAGPKDEPREDISIDVLFSPDGGCQSRIVEEIAAAEKHVRLQSYQFTSKPVADALIKAKKHGVDVEVILDKSQEKQTYARWRVLQRGGVKVFFDAGHEIANNKVILIDDHTIITGSYNFTKAAEEKNAENVLFIQHAPELFEKYLANFDKHREHSRRGG